MTDLSLGLRERLKEAFTLGLPVAETVQRSQDGTRKLLVRLRDGTTVESVIIPEGHRRTLCISTQVGCALGCRFCATGKLGLTRHMTPGEIAGQVLLAEAELAEHLLDGDVPDADRPEGELPRRLTNIVYMGMGEPLHNDTGTLRSLEILTDDLGPHFAARRITLSTVGLVPQLKAILAQVPVNLAISLHAPDEAVRAELLPINRKYPMAELLAACHELPLPQRRRITFEYVVLAGVNDSPDQADTLATAIEGLRCKVNLIPFNEHPDSEFTRPTNATVAAFAARLEDRGVPVTVRAPRGRDIDAACGQLASGPKAGAARRRAASVEVGAEG